MCQRTIPNANGGKSIRIRHPEDLADRPEVKGVYCKAGYGYCPACAAFMGLEDVASYDDLGCITCENCGKGPQWRSVGVR